MGQLANRTRRQPNARGMLIMLNHEGIDASRKRMPDQ